MLSAFRRRFFYGVLFAAMCATVRGGDRDAPRDFSAFHTLRGIREWREVLSTVGRHLNRPAGSDAVGSLCIVLDPGARLSDLLGEAGGAWREFLDRAPAGLSLRILRAEAASTLTLPGESAREAALGQVLSALEPAPLGAGGDGECMDDCKRAIAWLSSQPVPRVLLTVLDADAAFGRAIDATIRQAREAKVRVLVAGPEAPYSFSPMVMAAGPVFWRIRDASKDIPAFCDSKSADLSLFSFRNVAGLFLWDCRPEGPWMSEDSRRHLDQWMAETGATREEWLRKYTTSRFWPERAPDSEGVGWWHECTGTPPIPSGFGYWHWTRLAAETGGAYLVLSRRISHCAFRAKYDARGLAEVSPRVSEDRASERQEDAVSRELRWLVSRGVLVDPLRPGPEGGQTMEEPTSTPWRERDAFSSKAEVRAFARRCREAASSAAESRARLEAARAAMADRAATGPDARRRLAALDALRVMTARGEFHLLGMAEALGKVDDAPVNQGAWLTIRLERRVCRFWDGVGTASVELNDIASHLSDGLLVRARTACAVTGEVAESWKGTPVGAVAASGALWTYVVDAVPAGLAGRGPGAGVPGGTAGAGTPTSGGNGTGSD